MRTLKFACLVVLLLFSSLAQAKRIYMGQTDDGSKCELVIYESEKGSGIWIAQYETPRGPKKFVVQPQGYVPQNLQFEAQLHEVKEVQSRQTRYQRFQQRALGTLSAYVDSGSRNLKVKVESYDKPSDVYLDRPVSFEQECRHLAEL